jgi:hypothetical protein
MPIESPVLDDLTYAGLVQELERRIPVYTPEWTDFNDSDPGITLIQLFSTLAEQVVYRLNRVPEKNYVELLKLLGIRLEPAHAATTAIAFLLASPATLQSFTLAPGARVKAKSGVGSAPPPAFETDVALDITPAEPRALLTTKHPAFWDLLRQADGTLETPNPPLPATLAPNDPALDPFFKVAWDGKTPKLKDWPLTPVPFVPAAGHQYIWIGLDFNPARDAGFLGVRVTLTIQLDDDERPDPAAAVTCDGGSALPGEPAPPAVDWLSYYDAVTGLRQLPGRIDDATAHLTRSGTLSFSVPFTLAAPPGSDYADLRGAQTADSCGSLAGALSANLNKTGTIDLATFQTALTQATSAPPPGSLPVLPNPVPLPLRDPNKIRGWVRLALPAPRSATDPSPSLRALTFNAVSATNATTITNELVGRGDGRPGQVYQLANTNVLAGTMSLAVQESADPTQPLVTWTEIDSLDRAGPDDRVFELDAEAGQIIFGDGRNGRIPPLVRAPSGAVVALRYRFGGGVAGETGPGTITTLETTRAGLSEVTNFIAAAGGRDAETLDGAKLRARKELSTRTRAVTAGDFEWIALRTPEVRVARALPIPRRRPLSSPPGLAFCPDPNAPPAPATPYGCGCGGVRVGPRGCACGGTQAAPAATVGFLRAGSAAATALAVSSGTTAPCGPPLPAGPTGLSFDYPVPGVVSVVVVPDEAGAEPLPTPSFLRAVCRQLDAHRLITTEVYVIPPQYLRVCQLNVTVKAQPGFTRSQLQDLVQAALGRYLHVLTGGDDGHGYPFGGQVHIADLLAHVARVAGVARVDDIRARFVRTKSNAPVRQGALVLCAQAADEFEQIALEPEETVSVDFTTFTLATV